MTTALFRALVLFSLTAACGAPQPSPAGGGRAGGYSLATARADCIRCHQNAPFLQTKEAFCAPAVQGTITSGAMPKGSPYDQSTKAAAAKFCGSQ